MGQKELFTLMGHLRVRMIEVHHRGNGVSIPKVIGALSGIILTGRVDVGRCGGCLKLQIRTITKDMMESQKN